MTLLVVIIYTLLAATAFILQAVMGGDAIEVVRSRPPGPYAPEVDVALGAAFGLVVVGLSRIMSRHLAWAREVDRLFREVFRSVPPRNAAILAIASAVGEELFFRGFLQPKLGLWVTSILFGLAHRPVNRPTIGWTISALVVGVGLGVLYELTGAVLAPIVAHFTINFFNLRHLLEEAEREAQNAGG